MFGRKKLKEEIERLQAVADYFSDEVRRLQGELDRCRLVSVTYTLTESDLIKHKQQSARKKAAVERMARVAGYKITKLFPPEEIVEGGVVVGYRLDVDVKKTEL